MDNNNKSTIIEMVELQEEIGVLIGGLAISFLIRMIIYGALKFGARAVYSKKYYNQSMENLKQDHPQIYQKVNNLFKQVDNVNNWMKRFDTDATEQLDQQKQKQLILQLKSKMITINKMAYAINDQSFIDDEKYNGIVYKTNGIIDWSEKVIKNCDKQIRKAEFIKNNS